MKSEFPGDKPDFAEEAKPDLSAGRGESVESKVVDSSEGEGKEAMLCEGGGAMVKSVRKPARGDEEEGGMREGKGGR